MDAAYCPVDYAPALDIRETERAIKLIKDYFEVELARALNLQRVSAPLFVRPETGLNDNLNGVERPVSFEIGEQPGANCEIVHSLAKWKRMALKRYGFRPGEGLYTDMNAIRRDERTDNLHSLYVDQWDWERIIASRDEATLRSLVESIYSVLLNTERYICCQYNYIKPILPEKITFVSAQSLEDEYPALSSADRETEAARRYGAVFLTGIGGKLRSGEIHDGRAPDYDDWTLNGDIIVYYPLLDTRFELSSMGIRVDAAALRAQLRERGCSERETLPFHSALLRGELPQTAGGGIGQSRLCMFFLRKAHIGEVQSSVWPKSTEEICEAAGIRLL